MSHKLAKLIKYNKHNYQASKSASSKYLGRRLGDRPLLPSSIANVTTGTFAGLMLCIAIPAFFSSVAQAKSYSMTVTIDNSVIDMNVPPSKHGSFAKSSNSTVSVSTTNASGYTLSIASSGRNDGRLVNSSDEGNSNSDNSSSSNGSSNDGTNGNNYLSSISSATTEEQFKALDATGYNNMWGYLPSKWDGKDNTAFLPSPTTTGDVLDHTTTANPEANKYTLAIGARVDTTQRIGSYSNTYVVLATANGTPYTITYKDDTISNFPTDESATAEGDKVAISNLTPVKDGYTFLGWCSISPITTNGADICNGTTYNVGSTWEINQESISNNLTLYAMWQEKSFDIAFATANKAKSGGYYLMQDMTADICNNVAVGQTTMLYDKRDNEAYTIGKLKDNRCWMLDNLRLGGDSTIGLTPSDTNINSNYTLPASVTTEFSGGYTVGHINSSYKNQLIASYGTGSGKIGVYYNYCAASAGTYCLAQDAGIDVPDTMTDSPHDVCPRGWRMPTGGPTGEYQALYNQYSTTQAASDYSSLQYNLSTPLSGRYYNGNFLEDIGIDGSFWSSTYAGPRTMRRLQISATTVNPFGNDQRQGGHSVRCIANNE